MQFQQRGMWEKKNLRLLIRQFERNFFPRSRWHIFFISFLPYLSAAPYLQYAHAIPVCSVLQPCVSARQKSECRGLLDSRNTLNMHERRLSLLDTDRSQKNRRFTKDLSERRGRKACSQTGWLLIFFRLEKDGTFFLSFFFSIPLLQPCTFLAWRAWSSRV